MITIEKLSMPFDYDTASKPEQIAYETGYADANKELTDEAFHAGFEAGINSHPLNYGIDDSEILDAVASLNEWLHTGKWSHGLHPKQHIANIVRRLEN